MKACKIYFTTLAAALLVCMLLILFCSTLALSALLHIELTFLLNVLFINVTFCGDGFFAAGLCVWLFFVLNKKRTALIMVYTFLTAAFMVQVIKNIMQASGLKIYFEPGRMQYAVNENVTAGYSIFPSAHTAIVFALATAFVLIRPNKKWQLPVLGAALVVGYSRIYLAAHTLQDVIAGAFIGTISAVAVYITYRRRFNISTHINAVRKKTYSVVKENSLRPV